MTSSTVASNQPTQQLSAFSAIAIIVGIVIGAGIFKTPSMVAGVTGDAGWLIVAWVLGGVISLAGALCYAELATTYPHAGGDYHFLARAFGKRTPYYLEVNAGVPRLVPFAPRIPYVSPPVRDYYPANTGQHMLGGVRGDQPLQVAKAGRDKDEALAYGIYYIAIPGNFVMDFDVIISNAPPAQLAVTLDVAMNKGCTSLARYYLTGDVARVVSLPVHVQRLDFVEPRVFYAGVGDVTFRGASLREVVPADVPRR